MSDTVVNTANQEVLAFSSTRRRVLLQNIGTVDVFINATGGSGSPVTSDGVKLIPSGVLVLRDEDARSAIRAGVASDSTTLRVI